MQLPPGREGLRLNGQIMCGAFPDVAVEREFFVVDGNLVIERAHARATHGGKLMSIEATGRPVTCSELHAYRVKHGQIAEIWSEADFMGIMVQIGAVKLPGG
jgi:predicted ester cyclase